MIDEIKILLMAMTPLGELRLSLPIGITVYGVEFWKTYLISVVGNMIPVFFLLYFLKYFLNIKFIKKIIDKNFKKWEKLIKYYGDIALLLFVMIPFPGTGAWTGSLVANVFKISYRKALGIIFGGVLIAGFIVGFLTKIGVEIEKYFGWYSLLAVIVLVFIYKLIKRYV